jgi:hypothetical protein
MTTNLFLTTAFEIECRMTSTGLRASAPVPLSTFAGLHSLLTSLHHVEIEGEAPLMVVMEACDA